MSKLREHLEGNGIRQADFAARIGVTQGMVSRLVSGALLPSLELAVKIERDTGGAVPASSWIAQPAPAPADPTPSQPDEAA